MLVLVPIFALIFLAWAPQPSSKARLRDLLFLAVVALGVLFFGIKAVPDRWLYPEIRSMHVAETAIAHFHAQKDKNRLILILEGSSLTAYGIDGRAIEKNLRDVGLEVTVLQFSSPGANHFERRKVLREFFAGLTPAERQDFKDARVLLLREVFREYDENPLQYLESDELMRNVPYTDGSTILEAWRMCEFAPSTSRCRWNLVKCTVLHELGIGSLSFFRLPGPLEKVEPFMGINWKNPGKFDFTGAWSEFAAKYTNGEKLEVFPIKVPFAAWSRTSRGLLEESGPFIDRIGYFAPPVLAAKEFLYQKAFCQSLSDDTIAFGPPGPEVFRLLKGDQYWYDSSHVSAEGAKVSTKWLTAELAKHWNELF